ELSPVASELVGMGFTEESSIAVASRVSSVEAAFENPKYLSMLKEAGAPLIDAGMRAAVGIQEAGAAEGKEAELSPVASELVGMGFTEESSIAVARSFSSVEAVFNDPENIEKLVLKEDGAAAGGVIDADGGKGDLGNKLLNVSTIEDVFRESYLIKKHPSFIMNVGANPERAQNKDNQIKALEDMGLSQVRDVKGDGSCAIYATLLPLLEDPGCHAKLESFLPDQIPGNDRDLLQMLNTEIRKGIVEDLRKNGDFDTKVELLILAEQTEAKTPEEYMKRVLSKDFELDELGLSSLANVLGITINTHTINESSADKQQVKTFPEEGGGEPNVHVLSHPGHYYSLS
ncbi:hypothetical protein DID80_08605, partial [Candidatus Marinamargulisbacteria bacterium SCGC AAA071-K20]